MRHYKAPDGMYIYIHRLIYDIQIAKLLGSMWRELPASEKQIWKRRQEQARREHEALYPDYKYAPLSASGGPDDQQKGIEEQMREDYPATPARSIASGTGMLTTPQTQSAVRLPGSCFTSPQYISAATPASLDNQGTSQRPSIDTFDSTVTHPAAESIINAADTVDANFFSLDFEALCHSRDYLSTRMSTLVDPDLSPVLPKCDYEKLSATPGDPALEDLLNWEPDEEDY